MDIAQIRDALISETGLTRLQADVYLLVTCHGRMSAKVISEKMAISNDDASKAALDLLELGAFIDIAKTEFEAMHPRFAIVNMYRRMCKGKGLKFGQNKLVDGIGAHLEGPYDDARTK